MNSWVWVISLFFFCSCFNNPKPIKEDRPPLSRKQFIEITLETKLIDAIKSQNILRQASSTRQQFGHYKYTFEKYGIDKDDYMMTLDYYKSKPDSMLNIYDEILRRMHVMEDKIDHDKKAIQEFESKD